MLAERPIDNAWRQRRPAADGNEPEAKGQVDRRRVRPKRAAAALAALLAIPLFVPGSSPGQG